MNPNGRPRKNLNIPAIIKRLGRDGQNVTVEMIAADQECNIHTAWNYVAEALKAGLIKKVRGYQLVKQPRAKKEA